MNYHAITPFHIVAGMLALVFGYIALFSKKGAPLHRKTGTYFVYAMVTMSLTGAFMAVFKPTPANIAAGLLTFYFVLTGMLTVRRARTPRWIHVIGILIALGVGAYAFQAGRVSAAAGRPEAAPMFVFSAMALLGAIGDARVMRSGAILGAPRLARHLWRMCFAMWVAAASFFWGPPGRVPDIINIPALLPIPVLTPVVVMLYWLWRIRVKKTLQGIVSSSMSATAESAR
jgi:uncharacterized membrane protein